MSKKDIRRDYENLDYLDEKGKVKTKVVYKGAYYVPADGENYKIYSVKTVIFALLLTAAWIVPLVVVNAPVKALYFSLPYILQGISAIFALTAALDAMTERPPFREKIKKSLFDRLKTVSVIGGVFSAASVTSYVIIWCMGGLASAADIITGVCATVFTVVNVFMGVSAFGFKLIKTENLPKNDENTQKNPAEKR
ncbi:MAG: hypothetical protein IK147_04770 [Clostridia bacterium]|nr:hypothetical protein [Clostridia bacterium]